MFELWFYGNDGEFSYCIGRTYEHVGWAFRHAMTRIGKANWYFDGDSWSTERMDFVFESGHIGSYFITWVE